MTDGTRSRPSSQWTTASAMDARPTSTSLIEVSTVSGSTPSEKVRQACATRRTRSPRSANAAPRLATEVVFATPPFWFARAITQPDGPSDAREELFLGVPLAIGSPLVNRLEGCPGGLLRPHPLSLRTGSTV